MQNRPKPVLTSHYCKGCGRCIDSCPQHCIETGSIVDSATGLIPILLHLDNCNGCALCVDACPEPYGLRIPENGDHRTKRALTPIAVAGQFIPLPELEPLVIKGTYASAIGALLAGCRHFFGYPITPSTEGAELMAKILPEIGGVFLQAISEVATVNFMYGCGGAGLPCMTFTSSPGFSLMLEGISYMIGAEVPGVFVNVMRGGPGLGNIAPEQSDIKLVCRGLGHGNTHAIVLAPSTPQEMLDLTVLAFKLAFCYRNPVIVIADGYLGQMTGRVKVPGWMFRPGIPKWAVYGDEIHRSNLICSIQLSEKDLESHNVHLNGKYKAMALREQQAELFRCDDAELLLIACNTPARMAKGAVEELRRQGIRAGLFRPITVWPFPVNYLIPLLNSAQKIVMVEAGPGQLEDELRLSLSTYGVHCPPIESIRHMGGVLPQVHEIVERVSQTREVFA
jgi:pyruvate/2-oxoacid:ferredoxin oxidoreductase alpha subunit/NAD-dependent dihydropyrimidine dehydrogenase PreA subunit